MRSPLRREGDGAGLLWPGCDGMPWILGHSGLLSLHFGYRARINQDKGQRGQLERIAAHASVSERSTGTRTALRLRRLAAILASDAVVITASLLAVMPPGATVLGHVVGRLSQASG